MIAQSTCMCDTCNPKHFITHRSNVNISARGQTAGAGVESN